MNFPKRTQEIATILCQLLDGDTELSRKIVNLLKDQETEWQRAWHIHRLRKWHGSVCARRRFPEYQGWNIKWRTDFRVGDVVQEFDLQRVILLTELTVLLGGSIAGQVQDGHRFLADQRLFLSLV